MAKQSNKPNRLIMQRDEIGWFNISAYTLAVMGYKTPDVDRIAPGPHPALRPQDPTIADQAMEKLSGPEVRNKEAEEQEPVAPGPQPAVKSEARRSKRLHIGQGNE